MYAGCSIGRAITYTAELYHTFETSIKALYFSFVNTSNEVPNCI